MNIKIESKDSNNPAYIRNATEEYIERLKKLLPNVTITEISDEEYERIVPSKQVLKLVVDEPSLVKGQQ